MLGGEGQHFLGGLIVVRMDSQFITIVGGMKNCASFEARDGEVKAIGRRNRKLGFYWARGVYMLSGC